jgi:hypothetical protein
MCVQYTSSARAARGIPVLTLNFLLGHVEAGTNYTERKIRISRLFFLAYQNDGKQQATSFVRTSAKVNRRLWSSSPRCTRYHRSLPEPCIVKFMLLKERVFATALTGVVGDAICQNESSVDI